jgi:hypothetical protein
MGVVIYIEIFIKYPGGPTRITGADVPGVHVNALYYQWARSKIDLFAPTRYIYTVQYLCF